MNSQSENTILPDCQICLEPNPYKIDTSLFNCQCTFYSHRRCFIKFINSQQRIKTYIDCPICHNRVDLHESNAIVAVIANRLLNNNNQEVNHRIRSVNFLIYAMTFYILFWLVFIGKKILGY